jgi:uncharacterized coiled-coil DUF342 family protein
MTDTNNLVARLRLFGSSAVEREAADEIEDLQFQLAGTQGELENALSRERTLIKDQEDCRIGADNLHTEIERLSNELKNADKVCKTITELQERVKTLTSERDVAQRYICGLSWEDSRDMAKQLGWDCFKDQNE